MLRSLARSAFEGTQKVTVALSRHASTAAQPAEPAHPAAEPPSKTPRKRTRYEALRDLPAAPWRLAFRSLPYDAANTVLFPSKSAQPLQFNVSNTLFSMRCFPMPTRHPNGNPHPIPRSASKDLPSPPPTFVGLTDDDPSHLDPFLSTPEELRKHLARLKKQKKPYTMDLTVMAGKKKVHKSACVRDRCKRRFREAVRMVVVRGARKDENAPGEIAVSEEVVGETGPRKWLMAGYCYVVTIDLEMYRYPLPDLVEHVRTALTKLKRKAEQATLDAQLEDLEISPRAREPDDLQGSH